MDLVVTPDGSEAALTAAAARRMAERVHRGDADRYGVPLLDHVRRVVGAVSPEARVVAWLHEVLECTTVSAAQLRAVGVSEHEVEAIRLLTRASDADEAAYVAHVAEIAEASGDAGALARIVKRADLLDRLANQDARTAHIARPPYRRALALLGAARAVPRNTHRVELHDVVGLH